MFVRNNGRIRGSDNLVEQIIQQFPEHASLLTLFQKYINFPRKGLKSYQDAVHDELHRFHRQASILNQQFRQELSQADHVVRQAEAKKAAIEQQTNDLKLKCVEAQAVLNQKIAEWNHARGILSPVQEIARLAEEIAEQRNLQFGLENELSELEKSISELDSFIIIAIQHKADAVAKCKIEMIMLENRVQGNASNKIAELMLEQQGLVIGLKELAREPSGEEMEPTVAPLVSRLVEVDALLEAALRLKGNAVVGFRI
jgi:chromosome segregation ATPase